MKNELFQEVEVKNKHFPFLAARQWYAPSVCVDSLSITERFPPSANNFQRKFSKTRPDRIFPTASLTAITSDDQRKKWLISIRPISNRCSDASDLWYPRQQVRPHPSLGRSIQRRNEADEQCTATWLGSSFVTFSLRKFADWTWGQCCKEKICILFSSSKMNLINYRRGPFAMICGAGSRTWWVGNQRAMFVEATRIHWSIAANLLI